MTETWTGCYAPNGWKGVIVDQAFEHPAKFSRALLTRIYDELPARQRILDPFGGVALGAFEAMIRGHSWVGCELEEKFATLGRANLFLWGQRLDCTGEAVLHHGDSRSLCSIIRDRQDVLLSSPPYGECIRGEHGEVESAADSRDLRVTAGGAMGRSQRFGGYGGSSNLGNLPLGDFDVALSSPPFSEGVNMQPPGRGQARRGVSIRGRWAETGRSPGCGQSDGNLAAVTGETFWQAARRIVEQCFTLLRDGGQAIWVTKDYVKRGRRVRFTEQWLMMCRTVGFELERHVHASFVEADGKVRKSFFRHLHESRRRYANHWDSLGEDVRHAFFTGAEGETERKRLRNAQQAAWDVYLREGGDPRGFGDDTIIDHEDVLFLRKVNHVPATTVRLESTPGALRDSPTFGIAA